MLLCGVGLLIATRLAGGIELWMVHPIRGGSGEVSWTAMHWIGLRNLGLLLAWCVPGYDSVRWGANTRVDGPKVALTFDDAVGKNSTGIASLLNLLDDHKVPATFFVIANEWTFGQGRPDILAELSRRGHEIGNHGVEDAAMSSMDADQVDKALTVWEDQVLPVVHGWHDSSFKWFRPPQGMMSGDMAKVLRRRGYSVALGDVYSDDYLLQDTEYHVRVIKGVTTDGSVIILHVPDRPMRMHTLDILREVIPFLHGRGFSFVRLSELFHGDAQHDEAQNTCMPCLADMVFSCFLFSVCIALAACRSVLRLSVWFAHDRKHAMAEGSRHACIDLPC